SPRAVARLEVERRPHVLARQLLRHPFRARRPEKRLRTIGEDEAHRPACQHAAGVTGRQPRPRRVLDVAARADEKRADAAALELGAKTRLSVAAKPREIELAAGHGRAAEIGSR